MEVFEFQLPSLGGRAVTEDFSRHGVDDIGDSVQVLSGVFCQILSFRDKPPNQAVEVFVCAALEGAVRVCKVYFAPE